MKNFIKKCLIIITILGATLSVTNLSSTPVFAEDPPEEEDACSRTFLGMTSWDCGFNKTPTTQAELESGIWIIASNIFVDITIAASYLVLGFIIYGGYLYIFSGGDTGKVASGKKTLTNAFIGLGITLLANVILSSIRIAIIGNNEMLNCAETKCVEDTALVGNLLGWVLGITGVIAFAFVVIGGIGYITSAGDPNKVQKSRKTLIYALIGLAIVGLSSIISAFVTNIIKNANTNQPSAFINETTIAKEVTNEK